MYELLNRILVVRTVFDANAGTDMVLCAFGPLFVYIEVFVLFSLSLISFSNSCLRASRERVIAVVLVGPLLLQVEARWQDMVAEL